MTNITTCWTSLPTFNLTFLPDLRTCANSLMSNILKSFSHRFGQNWIDYGWTSGTLTSARRFLKVNALVMFVSDTSAARLFLSILVQDTNIFKTNTEIQIQIYLNKQPIGFTQRAKQGDCLPYNRGAAVC